MLHLYTYGCCKSKTMYKCCACEKKTEFCGLGFQGFLCIVTFALIALVGIVMLVIVTRDTNDTIEV